MEACVQAGGEERTEQGGEEAEDLGEQLGLQPCGQLGEDLIHRMSEEYQGSYPSNE